MKNNITISFTIDLEKKIDVLQELTKKGIWKLKANDCDILIWCIEQKEINLLKYLIEIGVDVNENDNAAIKIAAKNGYCEAVELLIKAGADKNIALVYAAGNGQIKLVSLLIEEKADVTAFENKALKWAAAGGYIEIAYLLKEAGVDIKANDNDDIQWALECGYIKAVKILLELGADVTVVYNYLIRELRKKKSNVVEKELIDTLQEIIVIMSKSLKYSTEN